MLENIIYKMYDSEGTYLAAATLFFLYLLSVSGGCYSCHRFFPCVWLLIDLLGKRRTTSIGIGFLVIPTGGETLGGDEDLYRWQVLDDGCMSNDWGGGFRRGFLPFSSSSFETTWRVLHFIG